MAKMQLYRVINPLFEKMDMPMDTAQRVLTPRLQMTMALTPVFDLITQFWKTTGCQLDTAVHALNKLDSYGRMLELALNHGEQLFSAQNINQQDLINFDPQELCEYIVKYDQLGICLYPEEEWAIWEYLWEGNRTKNYPQCISRQDCLFMFSSVEDAKKYLQERQEEDRIYNKNSHLLDRICKVEILDQQKAEAYDMRWLDNISIFSTYNLYEKAVNNYWSGRMTKNPLKEVLFRGTYSLQNI